VLLIIEALNIKLQYVLLCHFPACGLADLSELMEASQPDSPRGIREVVLELWVDYLREALMLSLGDLLIHCLEDQRLRNVYSDQVLCVRHKLPKYRDAVLK